MLPAFKDKAVVVAVMPVVAVSPLAMQVMSTAMAWMI
jgi:hypothetical protein